MTDKESKESDMYCRTLLALAPAIFIVGCASGSKVPYAPPDTPAGKVRTIAYMPYLGVLVPAPKQRELADQWRDVWNGIYPGTRWVDPIGVGEVLAGSGLYQRWAGSEGMFSRTAAFEAGILADLCKALGVEGLLQSVIHTADSGSTSSGGGVAIGPGGLVAGVGGRQSTGSKVSMAMTLVSCSSGRSVWAASYEDSYRRSYSVSELVAYAHQGLVGYMPYK